MKRLVAKADDYEMSFITENAFDEIAFQEANAEYAKGTFEEFIKHIDKTEIERMVSEELDDDSITFNTIVSFINSNHFCKADLTKMYERFKSRHHKDEKDGLLNPSEVKTLNDSVGDVTRFDGHIDFDNRDKCFVYIHPNQLLVSKKGQSHTQLLQDWCVNNDTDFESGKTEERLTKQELKDIDINKCSFGHIVDSIAFIDSVQNVSLDEVTKALTNEGFTEVYELNDKAHTIKRLAVLWESPWETLVN